MPLAHSTINRCSHRYDSFFCLAYEAIILRQFIRNLVYTVLESAEVNLKVGNITLEDAAQLRELTLQMYDPLYAHYYEMGGCEDMKPLLKGALELPNDKYRIRISELEKELGQERSKAEEERSRAEEERSKAEVELLSPLLFSVSCAYTVVRNYAGGRNEKSKNSFRTSGGTGSAGSGFGK